MIIIIVQAAIFYGVLLPHLAKNSIFPVLNGFLFPVFIFITVLITAAGYLINDITDIEIDSINKPERMVIGKSLSLKNAWHLYYFMLVSGFILSYWIALYIVKPYYILFYILAVSGLYFYSIKLKKLLIFGNLTVSFFSAGVVAIIMIFEHSSLNALRNAEYNSWYTVFSIFTGYMIFSFLVSLFREIVKDIEDIEGDKVSGARTLPIVSGVRVSKSICAILTLVILVLLFYWIKQPVNDMFAAIYVVIALILPLAYSAWLLKKANNKKDFKNLSFIIKLIMSFGIGMMFFYI
jgi:4-hydroxybenzoate polyprenyltransferase